MNWFAPGILAILLVGCAPAPSVTPIPPKVEQIPVHDRVQNALARLDENPDLNHVDYTPAVLELIEIGEPAIEPSLPYLMSENEDTRQHAHRVIYGALMTLHGYRLGQGWASDEEKQQFERLWDQLWSKESGSVEDAPNQSRATHIERIKKWLASRRNET